MAKIKEQGIVYKACRKAYIGNYFLVMLIVIFLSFFLQKLNLTFTFFPKTYDQIWKTFFVLGSLGLIAFLIEEPAVEGLLRKYVVTNNEVMKIEGILRKKKIVIPYQSVADVRIKKGVVGRIFNYGSVEVAGMKESIFMKAVDNPEEIQRIIQNKLNIFRSTVIKRKGVKEE